MSQRRVAGKLIRNHTIEILMVELGLNQPTTINLVQNKLPMKDGISQIR